MSINNENLPQQQTLIYQGLKDNDRHVIEQFYTENFHKIEKYITNNNGNTQDAQDIYQESFLELWRKIQLNFFKPNHEYSIVAYLMAIARNKWISKLRHTTQQRLTSLKEDETFLNIPFDEDFIDATKQIQNIKHQFSLLGNNCKELLINFYYRNESLRSISQKMGWTEATTKNNKYRCLQKLRSGLLSHQS